MAVLLAHCTSYLLASVATARHFSEAVSAFEITLRIASVIIANIFDLTGLGECSATVT